MVLRRAWSFVRSIIAALVLFARLTLRKFVKPCVITSATLYHPSDESAIHVLGRRFDLNTWETYAPWDDYYLEIRYTFHDESYRMIVHRGERVIMPPYASPHKPFGFATPGIAAAVLTMRDGTTKDITSRVLKYAGPRETFYSDIGLSVHAHELFPWWERDTLTNSHVTLNYVDGSTRTFSHDARDRLG